MKKKSRCGSILTKEFLDYHITELGKEIKDIGLQFNISTHTISRYAKKYGIHIRMGTSGGKNLINLTGKRFGKLLVLNRADKNFGGKSCKWICQCDCGNQVEIVSTSLRKGLTNSCGCILKKYLYKGIGDLSKSYWTRVLRGAKERNLEVSITIEDAWNKFLEQDRKCALTGIDLVMLKSFARQHIEHTASLDRIDSSKGYIQGNIQWVHKHVNVMKLDLTQDEFIEWCKLVVKHNS